MKKSLVLGAGGFIGNHLVNRLVSEGHFVVGADIKEPDFEPSNANKFFVGDLGNQSFIDELFFHNQYDEIYQLAADMGGAGYINTGTNDADVMSNSVLINANILQAAVKNNVKTILFTSTACVYPEHNQMDPNHVTCEEHTVYPADPDTEYGWEKLFSERMYLAFNRQHGMNNKIVRLHNVFGPLGTWDGGKEKAPAAICRKVAQATDSIEIWGNGEQTRSFLFIDECIEGIVRIMHSDFNGPVNLGSEQMISINQLVDIVSEIAGKDLKKVHIPGPIGVLGRTSHNKLIGEKLNWQPDEDLRSGLAKTYAWIASQVLKSL
jgi:nucleoside-diphosphate-sugar epimerase